MYVGTLACVIVFYRMEAKPAGDMPSTSAPSEKVDEGFSVPSSIRVANETAPKVELRNNVILCAQKVYRYSNIIFYLVG